MLNFAKILNGTLIVFGLAFFTTPTLAFSPTTGTVNTTARVRDSAGFSKVIVILAPKTVVRVINEKGSWYQIQRKDGSKGWIAKELVDAKISPALTKTDSKIASSSATEKVLITSRNAVLKYNSNLRKTPSIKGDIIKILAGGSSVQVSEIKNDWCSVKDQSNKNGWISCPLLLISPTIETKSAISSSSSTPATKINRSSIGPVTEADINNYWLEKVNALRQEKSLRILKTSEQLKRTAAIWVDYLGEKNLITHHRLDGKSMLAWADDQDIDFTIRNSKDGWKNNYFTENIGLRLNVEPTLAGVKSAMDGVLRSFLNEGPGGVHYRSLYHSDWNAVGVAWYTIKNRDEKYKVYFVFHYGSVIFETK